MTREIQTPAGPVRVGVILRYQDFGGTSSLIKVTNVEDDIKNGRPGFDGQIIDEYGRPCDGGMFGGARWGYADQVWWVSEGRSMNTVETISDATNVARGVAVDADARLAEAAAEVADAFAALAAGRYGGRTAEAVAAYRAAVADVSHPSDPNYGDGDADPLRWVTYVAEAAADGVREEVTRKAYA